jgi:uncharacterized membrane protein YcaP (DUF421 family)
MVLDPKALFSLDVSLAELVVRSSVVYLILIILLRVVVRREMGAKELPDMLMLVVIADGVQNGMAGEYTSVTGALVVASTIIGWNYLLDLVAYRFAFARRLLEPPPLPLIKDGRLLRQNMRRELITEEELYSFLRAQGVEDVQQVRAAYLEPSGDLSVVPRGQ